VRASSASTANGPMFGTIFSVGIALGVRARASRAVMCRRACIRARSCPAARTQRGLFDES